MHFSNFRVYSVKIGTLKYFRMHSGKRWVHSVSGRHDDDRWRNAPGVFRKASDFFNFRSLPGRHGNCRSACRHRTKFFEVNKTPVTLKHFCVVWISSIHVLWFCLPFVPSESCRENGISHVENCLIKYLHFPMEHISARSSFLFQYIHIDHISMSCLRFQGHQMV